MPVTKTTETGARWPQLDCRLPVDYVNCYMTVIRMDLLMRPPAEDPIDVDGHSTCQDLPGF
jgi:hypothetical protein